MKVWIIALFITIILTPMVQAHPHVFITPQAVIIINDHAVSQINVEWDFDEMSSSLFSKCYAVTHYPGCKDKHNNNFI